MIDTKILMDKILLIGDTIIDINTEGTLLGTAAETPTLVISKNTEISTQGGAALVQRNLSKLKCNYEDNKQKELIINKSRLAITQKRYNKTFYYSVKKSPFIKILDKKQLINLIKGSVINYKNNQIHLTNNDNDKKKITILFKKKNFDLIGWKINDQFENKISFLIKILSKNQETNLEIFKIPS